MSHADALKTTHTHTNDSSDNDEGPCENEKATDVCYFNSEQSFVASGPPIHLKTKANNFIDSDSLKMTCTLNINFV